MAKPTKKTTKPISDSDSSSSSDSDVPVQKVTKKVVSDSSDSDSDSSSEDEKPVAKKVAAKKAESSDSDSDSSDSDSSSEDEKPVAKKAAAKKAESSDSSDSDSSDSESEDEKPVAKKAAKKVESSDSDSSDSDSSSEDEKPAAKKADSSDSSDSDSDSSDSDSSSEDEKPAPKRKRSDDEEETRGDKRQKDVDGGANNSDANTVFVGGLLYDKTENEIRKFFGACGEIESIRIPTFPGSGRGRGIAFITFADKEGALEAIKLNEKDFDGRYVVVKLADNSRSQGNGNRGKADAKNPADFSKFQRAEKPEGCKTVFIGGLSFKATSDDLTEHFSSCGAVASARIAWDREMDRSKGFGYVDFESEDAVDEAVKLTGTQIDGRPIRVDYATSGGANKGGNGGGKFGGDRNGGGRFGGDRNGGGRFGGDRNGGGKFGGDRKPFSKNHGSIIEGKNKVVSLKK